MNKFKFFLPLAAVGLLASCSSDNLGEPTTPGQTGTSQEVTGDGAYVNINLSIPVNGTRAGNEYNDGNTDGSEYAIKNAWLYIFKDDGSGTKPGDCLKAIEIDRYFELDVDGNQVRPEITGTKEIEGIDIKGYGLDQNPDGTYKDHWVLVILNQGGLNGNIPVERGATTDATKLDTFDKWANSVITYGSSNVMKDGEYYTMTNALGWEGTVGEGAPTVCAKLENKHIYFEGKKEDTYEPLNVYVQRGLAKVSLGGAIKIGEWCQTDPTDSETIGVDHPKDFIYLTGWALEYTNTKSYPVQNLTGASSTTWYTLGDLNITNWGRDLASTTQPLARFYQLTNPQASTYIRCFWGVDPNYADGDESDFTYNNNGNLAFDTADAKYCLENTMEVAAMKQDQTTRVVLKGYYLPQQTEEPDDDAADIKGSDFISRYDATQGKTLYVVPNEVLGLKKDLFTSDNNYTLSYDTGIFTPFNRPAAEAEAESDGEYPSDQDDNAKAAFVKDYADRAELAYNEALEAVLEALNISQVSDADIRYHKDGEVYYTVLIRHFNDTETNITAYTGNEMYYDTANKALILNSNTYPLRQESYLLGRYGVLRNNWYELNLNSVKAVGTPYVPGLTDRTDDEPGSILLDVTFKINAWAKHSQGVIFK